MKKEPLTFLATDEMAAQLRELAAAEEMSLSLAIRRAVRAGLTVLGRPSKAMRVGMTIPSLLPVKTKQR